MSEQVAFWEFNEIDLPKTATHQEKFEAFHAANPHVYRRLHTLALQMRLKGHKKIGIAMLFEQMRWEWYQQTTDVSGYKLNNNYKAYYARLLMESDANLVGFFEVRKVGE